MALLKAREEGIRLKIELRRAKERDELRNRKIVKEEVTSEEHERRLNFLKNSGISLNLKETILSK